MYLPTVKYSRGKNNLPLGLWVRYILGDPRQKENCSTQQTLTLIKHVQIREAINKSLHVHENLAQSIQHTNNLASKGLLSFNAAEFRWRSSELTPCSLVEGYHCFRRTCCLHFQGRSLRWRKCVLQTFWYSPTRLYSVTIQQTTICISYAMRATSLMWLTDDKEGIPKYWSTQNDSCNAHYSQKCMTKGASLWFPQTAASSLQFSVLQVT
jgi:hypothetical protein